MGEIKSALELALERTADIKGDRESLHRHESRTEGKRLFARLREEADLDIKKAIDAAPKDRRAWIREGLLESAWANFSLPQAETDVERLDLLERVFGSLTRDRRGVSDVIRQVREVFQQYLDDRRQITEQLRRQFEPRLRQREQQLAQQYGRPVQLDPASDPEFAKVLQDQMVRLDQQYRGGLGQARQFIEQML